MTKSRITSALVTNNRIRPTLPSQEKDSLVKVRWPSSEQEKKLSRREAVKKTKLGKLLSGLQSFKEQGIRIIEEGNRITFYCSPCDSWIHSDHCVDTHLQGRKHRNQTLAINCRQSPGRKKVTVAERRSLASPVNTSKLQNKGDTKVSHETNLQAIIVLEDDDSDVAEVISKQLLEKAPRMIQIPDLATISGDRDRELNFAVILFDYDNMVGRGGPFLLPACEQHGSHSKPSNFLSTISTKTYEGDHGIIKYDEQRQSLVKQTKKRGGKGVSKQKLVMERNCFICRKLMEASDEVGALLNLETGTLACGSRNRQGMFHVFHRECLTDWVTLCHAVATGKFSFNVAVGNKSLGGQEAIDLGQAPHDDSLALIVPHDGVSEQVSDSDGIDAVNLPSQDGWANVGLPEDSCMQLAVCESDMAGPFCPECQGTGVQLNNNELEQPKYRLGQVYSWMFELAQARQLWAEDSSNSCLPPQFVSPVSIHASKLVEKTL